MLSTTLILLVTLAAAVPGTLGAGTQPKAVCVPPTMPPFLTWEGGPAQPLIGEDSLGRPVLVISRLYSVSGKQVHTFWVHGHLASVDPDPDNPAQPVLHDLGVMTSEGKIRGTGTPACQWSHPLGLEEATWR